jgi:hypothetical protein
MHAEVAAPDAFFNSTSVPGFLWNSVWYPRNLYGIREYRPEYRASSEGVFEKFFVMALDNTEKLW